MKLIITVDTEADNQWIAGGKLTTRNVAYLPRFQELCSKYGFCPTYLTTYEMAENADFQKLIGPYIKDGVVEIGAHLHPWSNPPFIPEIDGKLKFTPYPHELPLDLFKDKMKSLTDKLESSFSTKVTSYRAGRWGFCADHIPILLKLGYIVDSSVTPLVSWKHIKGAPDGNGGPDFSIAPSEAYILAKSNVCIKGDSGLLEIPMSISINKKMFPSRYIIEHPKSPLVRIAKYIGYGPQWFRPLPYVSVRRMMKTYRTWQITNKKYVEMMLHSSELMPGGSPYYKDQAAIKQLYQKLEKVFNNLKEDNVTGIGLSDFARSLTSP